MIIKHFSDLSIHTLSITQKRKLQHSVPMHNSLWYVTSTSGGFHTAGRSPSPVSLSPQSTWHSPRTHGDHLTGQGHSKGGHHKEEATREKQPQWKGRSASVRNLKTTLINLVHLYQLIIRHITERHTEVRFVCGMPPEVRHMPVHTEEDSTPVPNAEHEGCQKLKTLAALARV